MNEIEKRIKESSKDFLNVVLPEIKNDCEWLKEGEIISIEKETQNHLAHKFDILAGMDFLQIITDKGIRSIANRIQWGAIYSHWKSITIRESRNGSKNTELKKRIEAIFGKEGFLYPWLTIHSYLTEKGPNAKLFYSVVIKTKDLFECYQWHPAIFKQHKVTETDGKITRFIYAEAEILKVYVPEIYIFNSNLYKE